MGRQYEKMMHDEAVRARDHAIDYAEGRSSATTTCGQTGNQTRFRVDGTTNPPQPQCLQRFFVG